MNTGGKIDFVRNGLEQLVDGLRDVDKLAVITYSDSARVIYPMAEVGLRRAELRTMIRGLTANGGTALHDGLKLAFEEALKHVDTARQNRVLLLSDGQPTVGITSHRRHPGHEPGLQLRGRGPDHHRRRDRLQPGADAQPIAAGGRQLLLPGERGRRHRGVRRRAVLLHRAGGVRPEAGAGGRRPLQLRPRLRLVVLEGQRRARRAHRGPQRVPGPPQVARRPDPAGGPAGRRFGPAGRADAQALHGRRQRPGAGGRGQGQGVASGSRAPTR